MAVAFVATWIPVFIPSCTWSRWHAISATRPSPPPLFPAIVGDFFGRAHAGAIVGCLFALAGCMAAWGPVVAGAAYDTTGSYRCRPPRRAFAAAAG